MLALEYRTFSDAFTGNAILFTNRDETRGSFVLLLRGGRRGCSFVSSGVHCIFAEVRCELYRFVSCLRLQCTF